MVDNVLAYDIMSADIISAEWHPPEASCAKHMI